MSRNNTILVYLSVSMQIYCVVTGSISRSYLKSSEFLIFLIKLKSISNVWSSWLSSGNFFRGGGQNLLLCYCFRTKFQEGAKVFRGDKLPQRAAPAPLWKKASISTMNLHKLSNICSRSITQIVAERFSEGQLEYK